MFTTNSRWGFPYKMRNIIVLYEANQITLTEALERLGELYGSSVKQYWSYDGNGKRISHTCIEFGCPVVAQYVF